ncbi:13199_t:CDS:2, partial [Racocetra persica]
INFKNNARLARLDVQILLASSQTTNHYMLDRWNDFGYPLMMFMSRAFVTLIIEPGIWIASKIKYLARISWY